MVIEEASINLNTSCTKDDAVAILLGWMTAPIRPKIIDLDLYEILDGHTLFLPLSDDSLQEKLNNLRSFVWDQMFPRVDEEDEGVISFCDIEQKEKVLAKIDSLIHQVFSYLLQIDEELSKGEHSDIKKDSQASKQNGTTYITLRSLDRWAKKKYGISVLEDQEQNLTPEPHQEQPMVQIKEEDPNPEDGFSRTIARNVMTTFGFLVEAFAKTAPKFGDEKPNKSAIARHIADLAVKAGGQDEMDDQSYDAIRKRIKKALDTKNLYLKKFGK